MSDQPTLDPSLLDLFRAELEVHLPALSEGLLSLEKDGDQPKRLEALMRAAHSIKGAARIVGVDAAVRVAHAMEDCFVAAQNGKLALTGEGVDVLLRGVDALTQIAATPQECETDSLPALIEAIEGVRSGRAVQAVPVAAVVAVAADDPIRVERDLAGTEVTATAARVAARLAAGARRVSLDFAGVADVDPAGLTLLARLAQVGRQTTFRVEGAQPAVRGLLWHMRLDTALLQTEEA